LLTNAIKYRKADVPLVIQFKSGEDKDYIWFSVKDNGMGIDLKKNEGKVFGLYNRFHGKKIVGKGIGLNLVKAQAESLGGRVEVESKVNEGCTFTVYLPLNANADATS
jgi:signal transduction histidine kinase